MIKAVIQIIKYKMIKKKNICLNIINKIRKIYIKKMGNAIRKILWPYYAVNWVNVMKNQTNHESGDGIITNVLTNG